MLLKTMAQLVNLSHLRGIPGVSAWVGSHRWARLFAWWVFPLILWGTVTVFLLQAVQLLCDLGFQLTRNPSDPIWILSMLGSVFLEHSQEKRSIDVPLVDYLDPDNFLAKSYAHTVS